MTDDLWTIWPDQRITRRKLFHIVTDPKGQVCFRTRLFWEAVEFLAADGQEEYWLAWDGPDNPPLLCRTVNRKAKTTWQS